MLPSIIGRTLDIQCLIFRNLSVINYVNAPDHSRETLDVQCSDPSLSQICFINPFRFADPKKNPAGHEGKGKRAASQAADNAPAAKKQTSVPEHKIHSLEEDSDLNSRSSVDTVPGPSDDDDAPKTAPKKRGRGQPGSQKKTMTKAKRSPAGEKKGDSIGNIEGDLAKAKAFLTDKHFGGEHSLDCTKFLPPKLPVRIRVLDPVRVDQLLANFLKTTMATGKVLFMDISKDLKNVSPGWANIDPSRLEQTFNNISNVKGEFGEPWIIGGYHSSQAFIKWAADRPGEIPLRNCFVYRLSEVEGATYDEKLQNARLLSLLDNTSGQSTEGYDSQPFLVSTFLWRELYLQAGCPARTEKGHQSDQYNNFKTLCVTGDEKLTKSVASQGGATVPRFKVVSLDEESYKKAFLIMSSMDDREKIGADHLVERLQNVEPPPPPNDEEEEEGDDEEAAPGSHGKRAKGKAKDKMRSVLVEDMKETMKLPPGELKFFLKSVTDDLYVHEYEAFKIKDEVDNVAFTTAVGSCCILSYFQT